MCIYTLKKQKSKNKFSSGCTTPPNVSKLGVSEDIPQKLTKILGHVMLHTGRI